jgi:hypothetical protein
VTDISKIDFASAPKDVGKGLISLGNQQASTDSGMAHIDDVSLLGALRGSDDRS